MLRVSLLCLLGAGRFVSAAKVASQVQDPGSDSGSWWPFSSNQGASPAEGAVFAPGEEAVQDEALPIKQEVLPPKPSPVMAAVETKTVVETKRLPAIRVPEEASVMEYQPQPKAVDEFDALPDGVADQATDGVLSALFANQPDSKGEAVSSEETWRKQAGDVEHVAPPAEASPKLPRSAPRHTEPSVSLARSSSKASGHLEGKPNPQAQCMKFAMWAKETGVEGKELVDLLESTCATQAKHGDADAGFKKMCGGLKEKVADFETDPNWVPAKVCDILTKHLRLSGVGANPLEG